MRAVLPLDRGGPGQCTSLQPKALLSEQGHTLKPGLKSTSC